MMRGCFFSTRLGLPSLSHSVSLSTHTVSSPNRMATGMKRQYFLSSCSTVPSSRNSLQSSAMCSTMSVPRSVCFLSSSMVNSGLPSHDQCWAGSSFQLLVNISTLSLTMKAL